MGTEPVDYCREIETYLCRKNDGHLIRVVGPSFEIVSRWAADGVPLKIAFQGIDRYFERYYRNGKRRRPVRIDFCEADVLDVFDEWRRALGLVAGRSTDSPEPVPGSNGDTARTTPPLTAHLERALAKLTQARARGAISEDVDPLIDRVSGELDISRKATRGLRGEARRELIVRLEALDRELLELAVRSLPGEVRGQIEQDARDELAAFRNRMDTDRYELACRTAFERLLRDRLGLPTLTL